MDTFHEVKIVNETTECLQQILANYVRISWRAFQMLISFEVFRLC